METGKAPQALIKKPVIDEDLIWIYNAYHIIERARQSSMGIGRLSIGNINDYLQVYPIVRFDERERFIQLIFLMDDALVLLTSDKAETSSIPTKE